MGELYITKTVSNRLEFDMGVLLVSNAIQKPSEKVDEFLEKVFSKSIVNSGSSRGRLHWDSEIKKILLDYKNDKMSFIEFSTEISNRVFKELQGKINGTQSLIISEFEYLGKKMIGVLVKDHKATIIHDVQIDGDENNLQLKNYIANLSSVNSISKNYIVIDEEFNTVSTSEGKIFENNIFKVEYVESAETSVKVVQKLVKEQLKKADGNIKTEIMDKFNEELTKQVDLDSCINLVEVVSGLELADEEKDSILKKMEESHIELGSSEIDKTKLTKIVKKKKILTEDGIEIYFPYDYINDKGKVDYKINEDGSISLTLKKVYF